MVTNLYVKCDVCKSVIDLKWQVGHIERAPVSIVCPECKTLLKFILITNQENISIDIKSKNVTQVTTEDFNFIAETSSELLTYKITKQRNIIPGQTPFLRLIQLLDNTNIYEEYRECFLKGINTHENYLHIYYRINDLYYNKNYKYLNEQLKEFLKYEKCENIDEVKTLELLYTFNINYYSMYFKKDTLENLNIENLRLMKILRNEKKEHYENFLLNYCTADMLNEYDKRLYKSINSILDNYYLFLPATTLGYINPNKHEYVLKEYTLTTTDFTDIKHIYLTIYENLLKVYDIIILLNNIISSNSYSSFSKVVNINGKHVDTVEQFLKLSKGNKLKFLELNENYDKLMPIFRRKVRNAIGHESWDYIPYDHKIVFYNETKSTNDEMYLLEFVHNCWTLLDKTIIIYKVLQDVKRHRLILLNNMI